MSNITVSFTYKLPDDQYYLTNTLKKTATLEYTGPDKKFLIVDADTNKLTGAAISEEQFETYNEVNTEFYAIEVDCSTETTVCSMFLQNTTLVGQTIHSEVVPHCVNWVRDNPPDPAHTYSVRDIVVDPISKRIVKPLPWRAPEETWDQLLVLRNLKLAATDRQLSEDLPPALYTSMIEYRTYLRDVPVLFGVSWTVELSNGGTGFSVGDRLAITDSMYKLGNVVNDIMVTVDAVGNTGNITQFTASSTRALHHTAAAEYNNVYYTTNGAGIDASFNISKTKLVDPWKVTFRDSPLG